MKMTEPKLNEDATKGGALTFSAQPDGVIAAAPTKSDSLVSANASVANAQEGSPPPQSLSASAGEASPRFNHGYGRSAARVCASSQLSMGVVSVFSHVVILAIVFTHRSKWRQYDFQDSAYGIWCGVFFFLSGIFGLISSKSRTNGYIVTFMVFSIWSWVFSIVLITLASTVISARSYEMNDCQYSYNATTRVEEIVCRTWLMAPLMILNGVIIGAGFLEFVAALWAVAITGTALQKDQCCNRCCTCCCPSTPVARGISGYQPVQYVVANGTTTLPNGQRAMVVLLPAGSIPVGSSASAGGSGLIPLDLATSYPPPPCSTAGDDASSSTAAAQSFASGGQLVPLFPTISFPSLFPPVECQSLPPPVNPSYLSSASTTPGDSERGFV